jgi:hypothetical protein
VLNSGRIWNKTEYLPSYPLYTVYICTVYLFTQGRGGRGRLEPERDNSSQSWVENTI